jgi:dTDP-4-dehydrorhamnose reductase
MDTASIIQEIDSEISRLEQAKAILKGTAVKRSPGRPKRTQAVLKLVAAEPSKRAMSAEGRAKIAKAQRARWAKSRRAAKKAAKKTVVKSVPAKRVAVKRSAIPTTPATKASTTLPRMV